MQRWGETVSTRRRAGGDLFRHPKIEYLAAAMLIGSLPREAASPAGTPTIMASRRSIADVYGVLEDKRDA
jgi:hypothetical protein